MRRAIRSELTRLRRRTFVLGWLGISAGFAAIITTFVFTAAADGTGRPPAGPGAGFPTAAELAQPSGVAGGLGTAATLLGVITLSFWAIATANDYRTGLVRLLVQAEPNRVRLLAGKVAALLVWTAAATTVAMAASVAVAPLMAGTADVSTAAWTDDLVGTLTSAWVNTFLALCVWGAIGLVVAALTRSSSIAIGAGIAYVLVVESLVGLVAEDVADWLPGSTLTTLASGGGPTVTYGTAIGLGAVYATIGLATAAVTFARRDITE